MIHVVVPYRIDKNLGKAYNDAFSRCPDGDWLCLIDHDVLFLQPNTIAIMEAYTQRYPKVGLFTCYTNRIHPLATAQLFEGKPSEDYNIKSWVDKAASIGHGMYLMTELQKEVSGFLMLISKATWKALGGFQESGKALGVDNEFCWRLLAADGIIARMDNVLVWHSYRLNDISDKSHLR